MNKRRMITAMIFAASLMGLSQQAMAYDGYLVENCDTELLSKDEIEEFTLQELCYARNEIFARHGRRFVSRELTEYFEEQDWYEGTISPNSFNHSVFNAIEQANVDALQKEEYTRNPQGYLVDQNGYDIDLVLDNWYEDEDGDWYYSRDGIDFSDWDHDDDENGDWYYITSDYEPGIALHPEPDKDSDVLLRITKGEYFCVTEYEGDYGLTTYDGMTGWINLDYAELDEDYDDDFDDDDDEDGYDGDMSEDDVIEAMDNFADDQFEMDTVEAYGGYFSYQGIVKNYYAFLLKSYTGAFTYYYVDVDDGDIYEQEINPVNNERSSMEYVGNVEDYR